MKKSMISLSIVVLGLSAAPLFSQHNKNPGGGHPSGKVGGRHSSGKVVSSQPVAKVGRDHPSRRVGNQPFEGEHRGRQPRREFSPNVNRPREGFATNRNRPYEHFAANRARVSIAPEFGRPMQNQGFRRYHGHRHGGNFTAQFRNESGVYFSPWGYWGPGYVYSTPWQYYSVDPFDIPLEQIVVCELIVGLERLLFDNPFDQWAWIQGTCLPNYDYYYNEYEYVD